MPTATASKKARKYHAPLIEVKLGEAVDEGSAPVATRVELIRCGKFSHPQYGVLNITPAVCKSFVKNFSERKRKIDLAIDYSHDNESIAAGWIKSVSFDESTKSVWAEVKWTPKGSKVLSEREFRYLSAEFHLNHKDAESGEVHGPTLLGAGLTNRPFIKGMEPVVPLSEIAGQTDCMTPEEITKAIQALQAAVEQLGAGGIRKIPAEEDPDQQVDEEEPEVDADGNPIEADPDAEEDDSESNDGDGGLETEAEGEDDAPPPAAKKPAAGAPAKKPGAAPAKIPAKGGVPAKKPVKKLSEEDTMTPEQQKEFDAMKARNKELEDNEKKRTEDAKLAEKKAKFDIMLSEKKVVEAQRKPYMDGDVDAYQAAAVPAHTVRLSEGGEGAEGDGGNSGDKDPQDEILELSEKLVADKKAKDMGEAQSKVLADPKNAALRKRYEAGTYNVGQRREKQ